MSFVVTSPSLAVLVPFSFLLFFLSFCVYFASPRLTEAVALPNLATSCVHRVWLREWRAHF